MLRALPTLLLLLHYLLVVCASVGGRPELLPPRPAAYAHILDCQQHNAWRGGQCFEDCNGVQYLVHKSQKPQSLPQLLAAAKAIDLHCLPAPAFELAGSRLAGRVRQSLPGRADEVPAGVRGRVEAPPRQG